LQFIARGVFYGDTLPTRKPTGKKFAYQDCIVMKIDGEGKIMRAMSIIVLYMMSVPKLRCSGR
jgi:hypothetical protein